jgi:hypothetical protein
MARVAIPLVAFTRDGSTMPADAVGDTVNGHVFANDGRVGLIVHNTDAAAAHNLTINLARTVDGQTVTPRVVSVPASTSKAFGPFDTGDYGANVNVDVNSASLTMVAVRVA